MNDIGGYYGILPATVRHSKVSLEAKVMYAEITALATKEGYCFASNDYIGALYEKSARSISRWISELEKAEFIKLEVVKNQEGTHRYIIPTVRIDSPVIRDRQNCPQDDSPVPSNIRKKDNNIKDKKNKEPSWRYDFSLYQKECRDSVTAILKDADKMKELSELLKARFGEGWSTYRTLRNAFRSYWYTRDGWEKKKSGRAKKIDWFKTCRNIVKQDWNLVKKAESDDGTFGDILVG